MADYIAISDTQLDPDAPVTSQLMYQLRDNPIAIAEGDDGAPRIVLKSIERLVAGNSIRAKDGPRVVNSGVSISVGFDFMQIGTIRVVVSGTINNHTVTRIRNGVTTTISAAGGGVTVDVSVIPGDSILASGVSTGGTCTASLGTNGGNLWPGAAASKLEGNDV